jgi:hypothetical protein
MSETQEVFNVSELKFISFLCGCGTTVTMDIAECSGSPSIDNPPRCAGCGEPLLLFSQAVARYRDFYSHCGGKIQLRAKR